MHISTYDMILKGSFSKINPFVQELGNIFSEASMFISGWGTWRKNKVVLVTIGIAARVWESKILRAVGRITAHTRTAGRGRYDGWKAPFARTWHEPLLPCQHNLGYFPPAYRHACFADPFHRVHGWMGRYARSNTYHVQAIQGAKKMALLPPW